MTMNENVGGCSYDMLDMIREITRHRSAFSTR